MKRFLLVALLLVSAASVYAADLKITGDAEVRGVINNAEYDGDTVYKDKFFDADFNFNAALVLTENTTVFTKLTFDAQQDEGTATVPDSEAADAVTMLGVERAYISTKFLPMLTVDAGLMGGGMWGTAFGNTETNVTRIKGTYAVSEDIKVSAIYEKNYESNQATAEGAAYAAAYAVAYATAIGMGADEDTADAAGQAAGATAAGNAVASEISDFGDTTSYYLSANIKAGAFTIMPLFRYQVKETDVWGAEQASGADLDYEPWSFKADIAVTGDLGMIGFEAEVIYEMVKWDDLKADDESKYGVYVDVFAKLEMAKAGVALFYESADDTDGSFAAGEDFDFTTVAVDLVLENVTGMMAAKLYADDIKLVDKISADVAFAYGMQTDKDVDVTDLGSEIAFWEVDAGVNYAIDAATTYTIEGGYASIDTSDKAYAVYQVIQKVAVKF